MLKVRVLVDNNALIDNYYTAEAGFCLFLESEGKTVLFDAGYSDVFIKNAELMGVDLTALDAIALSHGHNDHTWGLAHLLQYYDRRYVTNRPRLVMHPGALVRKRFDEQEIGMVLDSDVLGGLFTPEIARGPVMLTDRLTWLGEVPRSIEAPKPIGKKICGGCESDDYMEDDTALVYDGEEGLVILTGCSHSGICNIVKYAMELTGKRKIRDILGGFHMLRESTEHLEKIGRWLAGCEPETMHPCHCTDLNAKIALAHFLPVEETGVGLILEYR